MVTNQQGSISDEKVIPIGMAAERDIALSITSVKNVAISPAAEQNTAGHIWFWRGVPPEDRTTRKLDLWKLLRRLWATYKGVECGIDLGRAIEWIGDNWFMRIVRRPATPTSG